MSNPVLVLDQRRHFKWGDSFTISNIRGVPSSVIAKAERIEVHMKDGTTKVLKDRSGEMNDEGTHFIGDDCPGGHQDVAEQLGEELVIEKPKFRSPNKILHFYVTPQDSWQRVLNAAKEEVMYAGVDAIVIAHKHNWLEPTEEGGIQEVECEKGCREIKEPESKA